MTDTKILRGGGVDGGGTFVEYVHEGRREQGWVYRDCGEFLRVETFSGDYAVIHHVSRDALTHVFSEAEVAEAMRTA